MSNKRSKQKAAAAWATIALLAERWPAAFVLVGARKPLKLGICQDIAAAIDGALTPREIGNALAYYTGSDAYLRACRSFASRVDLDGNPAGTVTADEAAHAREVLAARAERLARKRAETRQKTPARHAPALEASP